ncbi:MAG: DNA-binding transcriptional regulator OxyR [gamma proteobacterium symbiont of Lucinoma myriamae]|nr:DNA-binding transcriptional regulator OxyR [gamma proteobacterium symbiont of Lucinoma myriamae]MCU7817334.1 DNA-binding transcriptional regulator OxyR [gamma proteobacterium symbiont of Lucinoma myriamae]MCU7833095.1 DNA-binding transcriptional regulator OxyR [gamma proteobacterium symbiont of Lucinoma myriamae]
MNLRELEYLVAVDEERHFNRAAERCFVSQPTLSGQLKKLEEELGVMLIDRNTRHVSMTDVGIAVVQQARKILKEVKVVKEIAQSFDDPMAGELNVGLIPTIAPYLLPEIIPELKQHFPRLKLWLHEHLTRVLLEKLKNAELDLLILALPVESDEFSVIELFQEAFWLVVPSNETLSKKNNIQLTDLKEQEMLLLEEGHCLRGQALDICFTAGATENNTFRATSLETLRHMVSEGMGMTLLPELSVPKERSKSDAVHYIPFDEPKPNRRIGMLYRKGSYREEAYQKIAQVIKDKLSGCFF